MQDKKLLAVYALTPQGLALAKQIAGCLGGAVFAAQSLADIGQCQVLQQEEGEQSPCFFAAKPCEAEWENSASLHVEKSTEVQFFSRLKDCVTEQFFQFSCHIFIAATGIVVRCLAPLLKHKQTDPAVLVLDQQGSFVISLLSGHLGGGNAWAYQVAAVTGATPVITTATDVEGLPSLDMLAQQHHLSIGNIEAVAGCNARLLRGEAVHVTDAARFFEREGSYFSFVSARQSAQVHIGYTCPSSMNRSTLYLFPPVLFVGVGCKKATPAEAINDAICQTLATYKLAKQAVAALCSCDIKANESGLLALSEHWNVPFVCFSAEQLATFPVQKVSAKAMQVFGLAGVCEPAALAGAHAMHGVAHNAHDKMHVDVPFYAYEQASLLVPKCSYGNVTVAVALSVPYILRCREYD